jgi:hypothetical protein
MTNLTEQWKKGELPEGWYYVKGNRAEGIYAYTAEYLNNMYRPRNGEKIIEQVPSYDEWQQLKELLKECLENITNSWDSFIDIAAGGETAELIEKINQVLGEE